ncbi:glycosyltransferase family 4 protein [Georgenia alba]|uniref:Glycosyltransferase family 4 protein n=1 Tax=Georgenia alba TaxID=2233858 RepID=A0ABW2Q4F0_9MICO
MIAFVSWDDTRPSGGNTYDAALVAALRSAGSSVTVHALPGSWPVPEPAALVALADVLQEHPVSLVDGIVASAAPDQIEVAVAAGRRVVVLFHMATADEVGLPAVERDRREDLEGRALRAASAVVATSATAADSLAGRHGLTDVRVARPGATPSPVAPGSSAEPRLLSIGTLSATKDQATAVRALGLLRDLPWSARFVGPADVEPAYAHQVSTLVDETGLADRVRLTGGLTGDALEQQWRDADLLLLTSRTETFGLVVTEALARGVPAVVSAGTGAVEALGRGAGPPRETLPGCSVRAGDSAALATVLRRWLTEPDLRSDWRRAALAHRDRLPGWSTTAAVVQGVLGVDG